MSKKLYALISSLVSGLGMVGSAIVAFFQPPMYGAIISAIGSGVIAVNDILLLFVKKEA